jgi:hypothetical protein
MTVQGYYLSLAGWTFGESPWMDDSLPSKHPNNAWINGALDEVRIYNRALSASEVLGMYTSADKEPPSVPRNLRLEVDASSQIELFWDASTDNFRVEGYRVRRNGAVVAVARTPHFIDTGLSALTSYSYTVQAIDPGGLVSPESATVGTNTPAVGSPVEVIVDDTDGFPWVDPQGSWARIFGPYPPNTWGDSHLEGFETRGGVSVTFRPTLPEAGDYQVYIWNPGVSWWSMWVFATSIPVDIVHGGTTNTISLNEQINYGVWNYLGTYAFGAGTNGFLRIRTAGTAGDLVTADAVRFAK